MSNQAIYSLSSRLPQWVTHTNFGFEILDLGFWIQKLSYKAFLGILNNITYSIPTSFGWRSLSFQSNL
ncbi:hypothetical protein [Dendronalium sp. ChiSLP03b]|uniref:hypothetical protein n=1 Tax=Dendronalium sp. ChiSLP03b TaxID=3075381 RepID=UPI002AD6FFAA|nr:hypothetical protein [Dendronalium sp. ChiSLP03b]